MKRFEEIAVELHKGRKLFVTLAATSLSDSPHVWLSDPPYKSFRWDSFKAIKKRGWIKRVEDKSFWRSTWVLTKKGKVEAARLANENPKPKKTD